MNGESRARRASRGARKSQSECYHKCGRQVRDWGRGRAFRRARIRQLRLAERLGRADALLGRAGAFGGAPRECLAAKERLAFALCGDAAIKRLGGALMLRRVSGASQGRFGRRGLGSTLKIADVGAPNFGAAPPRLWYNPTCVKTASPRRQAPDGCGRCPRSGRRKRRFTIDPAPASE